MLPLPVGGGERRRPLRKHLEDRAVVGRGRQRVAQCDHLRLEVQEQPVGGLAALGGVRGRRVEGREHGDGVDIGHGLGWQRGRVGEPVPVGVDEAGQGLEPGHAEPQRAGHPQGAMQRGVVVETVEEPSPAVGEVDCGLDVVEHLEPRREAGLHGKLPEHPLRERVQRGDGGIVEPGECGPAVLGAGRPTGDGFAERFADALA